MHETVQDDETPIFNVKTVVGILEVLAEHKKYEEMDEYFNYVCENRWFTRVQIIEQLSATCTEKATRALYSIYSNNPTLVWEVLPTGQTVLEHSLKTANIHVIKMLHDAWGLHNFCSCCSYSSAPCINVPWINVVTSQYIQSLARTAKINCNCRESMPVNDSFMCVHDLMNVRYERIKRLFAEIRKLESTCTYHFKKTTPFKELEHS